MKKAKEYAEVLIKDGINKETVSTLVLSLLDEVKEIGEMRNAKSGLALVGIIKEQDKKWKAIAKIVNKKTLYEKGLNPDGFLRIVKKHFPFLASHL